MAGLDIKIRAENLEKVREQLGKLAGKEAKGAYAKAINDAAYKAQRQMRTELRTAFDRPTPFIYRSPKVIEATPERLSAAILPTLDSRNLPSKGGKLGVDPQQVLQAQEFGGARRNKKAENLLLRARILPAGMQIAIPADRYGGPFPGSDDGKGNFRASFLVRLFAYLSAFGEQGYRANMTDKSIAKSKKTQTHSVLATRRQVRLMDGWEFFISEGKKSMKYGRENRLGGRTQVFERDRRQNLAAGIWARQGKTLRAVIIFTPPGRYQPRISMDRIAKDAKLQDYLDKRVRFRIREAAGV